MPREFTELERKWIKEKFDALSPEEKERVMARFRKEKEKPTVATLTYKQLAQNYKGQKGVNIENAIRKTMRNMNREKTQVKVVNKPGSITITPEGRFMITKKGKSIRIGD